MSVMSATMYGQRKADTHCKLCGKPIVYGINGAMISEFCTDCRPIHYHCEPTPVRNEVDWDELDAMEDRCLGDDWD